MWLAIAVGAIRRRWLGIGPVILPRHADVTQPVEILNNPIKLRVGVWCFIETDDQGFYEFARQPDDALIFRLDARRGLQHKPCDVDRQSKRQNERQKRVEAGTQR